MRALLSLFLGVICITSTVDSCATVETGNSLLEMSKKNDFMAQQYLRAYIAGVWDMLERTEPNLTNCIGSKVQMSQLADVVVLYLKDNPQIRHFHPMDFIPSALKSGFSCK